MHAEASHNRFAGAGGFGNQRYRTCRLRIGKRHRMQTEMAHMIGGKLRHDRDPGSGGDVTEQKMAEADFHPHLRTDIPALKQTGDAHSDAARRRVQNERLPGDGFHVDGVVRRIGMTLRHDGVQRFGEQRLRP